MLYLQTLQAWASAA